jgi:hypothetical protein
MPSTNQATDHAVATMSDPIDTPAQMVTAGEKHVTGAKANSGLAAATEVNTAVTLLDNATTGLDAANKAVIAADLAAANARVAQATAARTWVGRARGCVNAVTVFAAGSKDVIKSFSFDVAERGESPLETTPVNMRGVRSKVTGTATWKWQTHPGNHGYMFQHATNPADPTTYSVPVYGKPGTFALPAQTPGATLYARVAAFDARLPGRQTDWTAWAAVLVSA